MFYVFYLFFIDFYVLILNLFIFRCDHEFFYQCGIPWNGNCGCGVEVEIIDEEQDSDDEEHNYKDGDKDEDFNDVD